MGGSDLSVRQPLPLDMKDAGFHAVHGLPRGPMPRTTTAKICRPPLRGPCCIPNSQSLSKPNGSGACQFELSGLFQLAPFEVLTLEMKAAGSETPKGSEAHAGSKSCAESTHRIRRRGSICEMETKLPQILDQRIRALRLGVPREHKARAAADEGVEHPSACAQTIREREAAASERPRWPRP